jgi:hypothetical protein
MDRNVRADKNATVAARKRVRLAGSATTRVTVAFKSGTAAALKFAVAAAHPANSRRLYAVIYHL